MKVVILKDGKFMGNNLRNVECKKGDVLETKGWYANKLIESKAARPLTTVDVKKMPAEEPEPVVDLAQVMIEERLGKVEETPIITPELLTDLKVTKAYKAALIKAGLNTIPDIEAAIKNGTLISTDGIGVKGYRAIKAALAQLETK